MGEYLALAGFIAPGIMLFIFHLRDEARWKREREEGTLD